MRAFTALVQQLRRCSFFVAGGPFLGSRRDQIIALAALRCNSGGVYQFRDYPTRPAV